MMQTVPGVRPDLEASRKRPGYRTGSSTTTGISRSVFFW